MEEILKPPYAYQQGYIALHLKFSPSDVPETLTISNTSHQLMRKDSFHVSLVCVKCTLEQFSEDQRLQTERAVVEAFADFHETKPLSFAGFKNDFRYLKEDEKEAVIALCDIQNIGELFSTLSQKLDIEIPIQPTHTTLYTLQKNVGIGVTSPEAMALTEKVKPGEVGSIWSILQRF